MSCTSRVALAMPRLPCLECTFCENVSWKIAQWSAVSHARVKSPVSRQNIEQSSAAGRPLLADFFSTAADLLLLNPKYDFKPTPAKHDVLLF